MIEIDFAPRIIDFFRENRPEVNPKEGDVRRLDFQPESVDGYWSLGLIEHFYKGFDQIVL